MKLKKFIAVMATVGMVASLAVGCGGSSEDTSAEGGDAAAEGSSDWDSSMDPEPEELSLSCSELKKK